MTKKLFSILLFIFILFVATKSVQAQEVYPNGCSSAIGYSITTGMPCNGTTNNAITEFIDGCTTALGYSTTTGAVCSGGTEALPYLAGCTAITGHSSITGAPCNGTNIAYPVIQPNPIYPGLPLTGAGGNVYRNILVLLGAGIIIVFAVKKLHPKLQKI